MFSTKVYDFFFKPNTYFLHTVQQVLPNKMSPNRTATHISGRKPLQFAGAINKSKVVILQSTNYLYDFFPQESFPVLSFPNIYHLISCSTFV